MHKSTVLLLLFAAGAALARPPKLHKAKDSSAEVGGGQDQLDLGIEYNRYLQEVVQV